MKKNGAEAVTLTDEVAFLHFLKPLAVSDCAYHSRMRTARLPNMSQ